MKIIRNVFSRNKTSFFEQRGGMMVDLLLTLALAAVVLPFIFDFQKSRIERANNIAVSKEMSIIQTALERYMDFHKKELLKPIGKNITRVKISDLEEYGVPSTSIEKHGDKLQVRVLKSGNRNGHVALQGIIVLNDKDITPLRTREIINLGDGTMGFVEDGKAFGAFGTWHANTSDLGILNSSGIVQTTKTTLDEEKYLWRIPSQNSSDSRMLSALSLGRHNIINAKFADAKSLQMEEILRMQKLVANKMIFQNRTTIDKKMETSEAIVSGTLSADSRGMEITGTINLADTARFSNFTTNNLWVNNLNLSGLSISADGHAAILKVNQTIDMVAGHITTMYTSVGFTGSITPKLYVRDRIEDSSNSAFFWDLKTKTARLADISIQELNRMAVLVIAKESDSKTVSGQIFSSVAANKNATASDFMNAISEIQKQVRLKYRQLNLE